MATNDQPARDDKPARIVVRIGTAEHEALRLAGLPYGLSAQSALDIVLGDVLGVKLETMEQQTRDTLADAITRRAAQQTRIASPAKSAKPKGVK